MKLKMSQLSILSTALVASITLILLSLSVEQVASRPSIGGGGWKEYHAMIGINDPKRMAMGNYECENSPKVQELCQRCAKVTKSNMAYPMCCENRDNAKHWCQQLLMIG